MTERSTLVASRSAKRRKRDLAMRFVLIGCALLLQVDLRLRRDPTVQSGIKLQRTKIERKWNAIHDVCKDLP